MSDVEPDVLEAMLTFMYVGKTDDLETMADKLLAVAERWLVRLNCPRRYLWIMLSLLLHLQTCIMQQSFASVVRAT